MTASLAGRGVDALYIGGTRIWPAPNAGGDDPFPDRLIVTMRTTTAGQNVNFLVGTRLGGAIDWGDGTIDQAGAVTGTTSSSSARSHTYADPGDYEVAFIGRLTAFGGQWATMPTLISVDHWGSSLGLTDLSNAFPGAVNLIHVAEPPPTVTNMTRMFQVGAGGAFREDISQWNVQNVTSHANFTNIAVANWPAARQPQWV